MRDRSAYLYLCPICDTPGRACGDDHVRVLITSETIRGDVVAEPLELKEYTYLVGHIPITAMLTEAGAARLNAVEGTEAPTDPGVGNVVNNEAQRTATTQRAGEDDGAESEDSADILDKARRNRRRQP